MGKRYKDIPKVGPIGVNRLGSVVSFWKTPKKWIISLSTSTLPLPFA